MANFIDWAKNEMNLAGGINHDVLELLNVFDSQGHSGCSAEVTRYLFDKIVKWESLTPIENTPESWSEFGQHKRASSVFKDEITGECYQSNYYIFEERDGVRFTGKYSRKTITKWPYTVGKEIIKQADCHPLIREMVWGKE